MKNKTCSKDGRKSKKRLQRLEDVIYKELIEHDIMVFSDLLQTMRINIECPQCTSFLEKLMAIRRDLKMEGAMLRNGKQDRVREGGEPWKNY